ncbi:MAG: 3,4-dihydroxy-2-butanone-4-phosphate synthase [Tannerella sp.]|jgi:3,4-dihydroxy 2-butanone 4-phosphate synthase/GTP cyclohydrolase II|nr:3,4-dihydroxy-2-butanone-4-phosphate synthase [Tannerella sp.]
MALNTIKEGLEELRQGNILIVVDDEDRENEGDFIVSGEKITPEIVNFMLTYGRGIMCVPLTKSRCKELQLEMMAHVNTSLLGTPFTMSVDLRGHGCTTGVSSRDRAATIKALMDPSSKPDEFARPGHIFPLQAAENGVLERRGHTEALVDMTRLAGLTPGGALIEILNPDGTMARLPQLLEIAKEHNLKICSIADLVQYRIKNNL